MTTQPTGGIPQQISFSLFSHTLVDQRASIPPSIEVQPPTPVSSERSGLDSSRVSLPHTTEAHVDRFKELGEKRRKVRKLASQVTQQQERAEDLKRQIESGQGERLAPFYPDSAQKVLTPEKLEVYKRRHLAEEALALSGTGQDDHQLQIATLRKTLKKEKRRVKELEKRLGRAQAERYGVYSRRGEESSSSTDEVSSESGSIGYEASSESEREEQSASESDHQDKRRMESGLGIFERDVQPFHRRAGKDRERRVTKHEDSPRMPHGAKPPQSENEFLRELLSRQMDRQSEAVQLAVDKQLNRGRASSGCFRCVVL